MLSEEASSKRFVLSADLNLTYKVTWIGIPKIHFITYISNLSISEKLYRKGACNLTPVSILNFLSLGNILVLDSLINRNASISEVKIIMLTPVLK